MTEHRTINQVFENFYPVIFPALHLGHGHGSNSKNTIVLKAILLKR